MAQLVPLNVLPMRFTTARFIEIKAVKTLIENQNGSKLAFQKLPRHMRRRVMGHTLKRVPNKIKQIHFNQLKKSGLPPKQKRPSRKYRRKRRLLNDEIQRRQRSNKWLETHIWHTKRFNMITKWSYKIPYKPTDKAFKACYRATMKHCLLQDISYVGCIQLTGKESILIKKLKKITRSNEGLSMHAKAYINGNREGKTTLYTQGNIPIGSVTYHWKPQIEEAGEDRQVWIWAHAAYFEQVFHELVTLFGAIEQPPNGFLSANGVEIKDFRLELNRLRLTGPLSQAILSKSLKPVNAAKAMSSWCDNYLRNDTARQLFSEQIDYWNKIKDLQTPALLSPHIIISLMVTDPRCSMPNKRTKAINSDLKNADVVPPTNLSYGPMWDTGTRDMMIHQRETDAAFFKNRSSMLVPGSEELSYQDSQLSVMLIQRPGEAKTGFTAGWDVIVPKGCARATWLCFIMWGGRAGGYRETDSINFETSQQPLFPPDTIAGVNEDALIDEANKKRYFSLPPNKRTNYNKFTSVSSLCCNWKVLLEDWRTTKVETEAFTVLRDKKLLQDLQLYLTNRKHRVKINEQDYLIPVKVTLKKGTVSRYTMICMPKQEDNPKTDLLEPKKTDVLQIERKKLRAEHKTIMQRLKKKRHTAKVNGRQVALDKSISDTFIRKIRDLWLPEATTNIRKSACREIMGFVLRGGVSLSNGNSHGIGYIPVTALMQFLTTMKSNQVLVRNTDNRLYRFATLEIIQ